MNYSDISSLINELRKLLPPIFTRQTASKAMGGLFSPKTLSNLDAAGKGPASKQHIGKKAVYFKEDFLSWLQEKLCTKVPTPKYHNQYW